MQDLIPYLVKVQFLHRAKPGAVVASQSTVAAQANGDAANGQQGSSDSLERVDSALPSTGVGLCAPLGQSQDLC